MKQIRVHETGGPETLVYEEVDRPVAGPGQLLVKVAAAGVNYIDIYHRQGLYPLETPFTPGREIAGTVAGVGPAVTDFSLGDSVAFFGGVAGYSEYVVIPAERTVPVPAGIDLEVAAATMLQGMTAHYLAYSTYPLQPGDTALIHAAAGGVGLLLVQLAKRCGATVIGTVSTAEKAALARAAGADHVIQYSEQDFAAETRRLTNDAGVNVVYDSVGQTTFDKGLGLLKLRGYFVLYGQASGPVPDFDLQRLNQNGSLFITRPSLFHYVATRAALLARAGDLFAWIAAGELDVRIDQRFKLAAAAEAHRYMEARRSKGKVLLIP